MDSTNLESVIFVKNGCEPEVVPVSFIDKLDDTCYLGVVLSEPQQNFGVHQGNTISYFPYTEDDDYTIFICDFNLMQDEEHFDKEVFSNGRLLEEAIVVLKADANKKRLFNLLRLLRDCEVCIPCVAHMSERDLKYFTEIVPELEDKVGQTKDEVRLVPDILMSEGEYYFPVFSRPEEMGEYGNKVSIIQDSFLRAITLAKNNEKHISGIVINPFSNQLVIPRELWGFVERMASRF